MADHHYEVRSTRHVYQGRVTALRTDVVAMPGGVESPRDVVMLPGAVAIVALDDQDNVLMVRQYRHPVARRLWEIPAGLLDSTSETALEAGQRELFEEGHLRAEQWNTLVDVLTSPGMTDETIRILLARNLTPVPVESRFVGFHEEAELEVAWWPLRFAVQRALNGELENGMTVAGILAVLAARSEGFRTLRAPDAAWSARKRP